MMEIIDSTKLTQIVAMYVNRRLQNIKDKCTLHILPLCHRLHRRYSLVCCCNLALSDLQSPVPAVLQFSQQCRQFMLRYHCLYVA